MAYTATARPHQSQLPRRSRRRPARSPIRWDRVGRLGLLATLAVIVLLYIPPALHWLDQDGTASRAREQLHALQREHDRLNSQLDALSTPAGIEAAARRLGMVRSTERPYVIEGLPR